MTNAPQIDPKALRQARAAHLRDLLEPWSLRRLEARTGIGRGTLETRLSGRTELAFSDIELLAPVIRMTPAELFDEILKVELPGVDSNHEPIGSQLAPVIRLTSRERDAPTAQTKLGRVTPIRRRA